MLYYLKKLDWFSVISAVLLSCCGLVSIYSSSLGRDNFVIFQKQVFFLLISVFLMFTLGFFDWRSLRENPYLILFFYFVCILLLIGLFFFAPAIKGTKEWYKIGPFSINPIEFTKVILAILLAKYFSMRHVEMYKLRHILFSGLYVLLPSILIFFQPEFGSIIILTFLWAGILIISGIKLRHFLVLIICGILIFISGWSFFLKDYQKERIISFFTPKTDPLGISWSQNQAKIAIGSGGILGEGFRNGSQTQYGFLPEPHTDFIFSAIAEEFGLFGISIVFILFIILIWRIMKIAISAESNFPRLFASGFTFILVSQIFINIGMNLGILPVIGIPLPLISYGGSSLISIFIGIGILQSIKTKK